MKRKKKKAKRSRKKVMAVYCHYAGESIPLGRARKRCPNCSAVLNRSGSHVPFIVSEPARN
jgi:hypothetical protein